MGGKTVFVFFPDRSEACGLLVFVQKKSMTRFTQHAYMVWSGPDAGSPICNPCPGSV